MTITHWLQFVMIVGPVAIGIELYLEWKTPLTPERQIENIKRRIGAKNICD